MDKNAIKKFATWARRDLIFRVSQKAAYYGVTAEKAIDAGQDYIDGRILSATEKKQRDALVKLVKDKGYEEAMEEVAYTWFNRFTALRYMEVNNYLPSHVRVFTDSEGKFRPQILDEAIHLNLPGLDMNVVYDLKSKGDPNALYRYLLIVQCNALNEIMPVMFQKIADYTELLFPDNLLRDDSVLGQMMTSIPEDDWTDQIQIIGWLYQYYNAEKKDKVFADLKKNIKITKDTIPAATQLFTPDWIVRYMVENSLGRLWTEGHPQSTVKSNWKYYLEEAEQEEDVKKQLDKIRAEYSKLSPEDITCIDPCSGSGHILVYMFDVLMQIYTDCGYTVASAVKSILENNIYGLDIDDRAAQLSYFSVMMKARSYDEDFFEHTVQPHVYVICESNNIDHDAAEYFMSGSQKIRDDFNLLTWQLHDAKEYGSIIMVDPMDFDALYARVNEIRKEVGIYSDAVVNQILPLIHVGELLSIKYYIVVTNPPYLSIGGMGENLNRYVKDFYPNSKSDMFAVLIDRCKQMICQNGFQAMITQHVWMFITSYEKFRTALQNVEIINMIHLGSRAFEDIGGEVVQTVSFIMRPGHTKKYIGTYCRLVDENSQSAKETKFLSGENRYYSIRERFRKIPGMPIAYWISNNFIKAYDNPLLSNIAFSDGQILTGNNDKYLRYIWEVDNLSIKDRTRWVLHAKGGEQRRWYGNVDTVVNWTDAAISHYKSDKISRFPQDYILFRPGITWSLVSSGDMFSMRYLSPDTTFNKAAATILFNDDSLIKYTLGFLNSVVAGCFLKMINPTLSTNIKDVLNLPIILKESVKRRVEDIVDENIMISRIDWDSFETSWDFRKHPLIRPHSRLSDSFCDWSTECSNRVNKLKTNEEELNRIFIDIYGLNDELGPIINRVTICNAHKERDIRSLISYAVGCMFGRYSLDEDGLVYAGGEWDNTKYATFIPDKVNIIPITDDEYFEDDIVNRFVDFVRIVYGEDTLEENLQFIADALGGKGTSREIIRNYFLNDFFADHCRVYQKHPIYWLFESNRKSTFKCLIYMHRYKRDTIARIRTDYVHEQQSRYNTAIEDLESQINKNPANVATLKKRLDGLKAQAEDLRMYEEKIHHLADQYIEIDLDDGVAVNYAKFKDVLAVIK